MNVNSALSTLQLGNITQSQPAARPQTSQTPQPQAVQESAIVKLSTRAIELNQAANQAPEVNETASSESAEPAAVQRTESESPASQARSIDVYA